MSAEKELLEFEEAMALKIFVTGAAMTEKEAAHLKTLRERLKRSPPFAHTGDPIQTDASPNPQ